MELCRRYALLFFVVTCDSRQLVVLLIAGFPLLSTTPAMLAMVQEYSNNGSFHCGVADLVGLETIFVIYGGFVLTGMSLVFFIKSLKMKENLHGKAL
jgi:MFS transporter, FSR family, fosmidomycin resistance protein